MTDKDYIQAFLKNDQKGTRAAYYKMKGPFLSFVRRHFTAIREEYLLDIYQDAIIRLQQNILTARLTEEKLTSSLQSYLNSVGYFVAQEMLRDTREELLPEGGEIPEDVIRDVQEDITTRERNRIIRMVVASMEAPCAPILEGYYWDQLSMEELAVQLGYANGDSVKNQKARCMKKLKTFIKSQLHDYGYGE